MGYVACLGQIPEETAHVLQNLVSANGLTTETTGQIIGWVVSRPGCSLKTRGRRWMPCSPSSRRFPGGGRCDYLMITYHMERT